MKKILTLLLVLVLSLSMTARAESAADSLQEMYAQAELLMVQGDYTGAAAKFEALGAYSDSSQMAMYCKAIAAAENLGLHLAAVDAFTALGEFKDSQQMAKYYKGRAYEAAGSVDAATASDSDLDKSLWHYGEAEKLYSELAFFKDSMTRLAACGDRIAEIRSEQSRRAEAANEEVYQTALALEQSGDYAGAIKVYKTIEWYRDSYIRISACQTAIDDAIYQQALSLEQNGEYTEAIQLYQSISAYKDSAERVPALYYTYAEALIAEGKWNEAVSAFISAGEYEDAAERVFKTYYMQAEAAMAEGRWDEASAAFKNAGEYNDAADRINEPYFERDYLQAGKYLEERNYYEARAMFLSLDGYKDSAAQAQMILDEHWEDIINNAEAGDVILFGSYEQDNDTANGPEPIEWLVIDKAENKVMVVSRKILDCSFWCSPEDRPDPNKDDLTFDETTICQWLNDGFYHTAFSEEEKSMITGTMVRTDYSNYFSNEASMNIFLLSKEEIKEYDCEESAATEYAKAKGADEAKGYWLREYNYAVRKKYDVDYAATSVGKMLEMTDSSVGVRPVMWIWPERAELLSQEIPYEAGTMFRFSDGSEAKITQIQWIVPAGSSTANLLTTFEYTKGGKPGTFITYIDERIRRGDVAILTEEERMLTEYTDKETVKAVQTALNEAGFPCGTPDGAAGKKTIAALTDYQTAKELTITGTITLETLISMGLAEH